MARGVLIYVLTFSLLGPAGALFLRRSLRILLVQVIRQCEVQHRTLQLKAPTLKYSNPSNSS
jgi:hypothetical protein